MKIHEPDASGRQEEDALAPEAYQVNITTTPYRHTLKGSGDGEVVHPFVMD
jgi:hypothetical protein